MSDTKSRLAAALADRYRIERELGQGGMATVYLAQDLKHDRKVAVKVLRPELAAVIGAERFLREIKTIANLQHPHILGLIDSGEVGGTAYFVMPFVQGESLRDRLAREKQLSISEAVRIAAEVAAALDYAHRHGVVHRDIKPENILLHDGSALVADFGIALAASTAGGSRMTETGMSLGTPHYMSPEQAMGEREITARSDIYALGCVTYEMLVGEPPFTGPTAQAIVARMMTEEPRSLLLQRKTVPGHVDDAVLTALSKIPADRFATAAEFAAALASESGRGTRRIAARSAIPRVGGPFVVPALLAALAMALGLGAWGWLRPSVRTGEATPRSLNVVLPDSAPIEFVGEAPIGVGQTAMALSRDGRILVYVGGGAARPRLYVRPLDRFQATPLAGTEGAYAPFLSPDGAWIGFFADNQVKKIPVGGGPVTTLAEAPLSTGAAWSEQGNIVFLTSSGSELFQVSANGGRATTIARLPSGSLKSIGYLPGERWLLCTVYSDEGFYAIVARSTDGTDVRVLVRQGPARQWRDGTPFPEDALIGATPSYDRNGALLFTRADGSLVSIGLDLKNLKTYGEPAVIAQGVRRESWTGHSQVALGGDGTLAYVPGTNSDVGVLAWLDRAGRLDTLPFPAAYSLGTDVAPDGASIAITIPSVSGSLELWTYDLRNGVRLRVLAGLCDSEIRWTPEGEILACLGGAGVVRIDPARPGKVDTLLRNQLNPAAVSRDGSRLLLGSPLSDSSFLLMLDGRSAPEPIEFTTGAGAFQPTFSPDGRWVSYLGRNGGVFVEPFPITGEVYRISNQLEGDVPTWPNGNEIFFPSGSQLYVVKMHPGPVPRFDPPRILATQRLANLAGRPYAVSADGRRFLIKLPTPEHSARSIRLVVNRHE
jgi:serine/threonine-protein kinase